MASEQKIRGSTAQHGAAIGPGIGGAASALQLDFPVAPAAYTARQEMRPAHPQLSRPDAELVAGIDGGKGRCRAGGRLPEKCSANSARR